MNMNGMFNGMFGKIGPEMCRLSMNGGVAVKTGSGYKTYNLDTNRLVNCDQFVFNIGDEMFFIIPTNKAAKGDIILVGGKPKCVVSNNAESDGTIKVVNYETGTVENILPERHVFMGETYFYGKIVSMFGSNFMSGKKGMNKLITWMMMSEMMKGNGNSNNNAFGGMLPLMMMSGGNIGDMFNGMFDFDSLGECFEEDKADAATEQEVK